MADPKASSLVTSFAMKWLNLDDLDQVVPDPMLFPGFNDQLRRDFSTEARSVRQQHLLGGSQRRRPADRRPHVPERTAGAALRHLRRYRPAVPQGHADR